MSWTEAPHAFKLGDWIVSPQLDRIQDGEESRHLEPRSMDLLVFLSRRPAAVVSKDEIIAGVWEAQFISDSALSRVVADVRQALGDDARHPRFIETIPKRGYRLIADVRPLDEPVTARPARLGRRRHRALALALGLLLAVVGYAIWSPVVWRARKDVPPDNAPPISPKRIVVLPFQEIGPPGDPHFAVGISDEITTRLASARGLAVISRQSAQQYAASQKSAREIGRELSVQYILEGSVRWESSAPAPYRVRISPQLIRTADDEHIWASSFDGVLEDALGMQIEIAEAVLEHLDITLGDSERSLLLSGRTANPEAYRAYLRGLSHLRRPDFWSAENMRLMVQAWELAVEIDPDFATAHAALGGIQAASFWMGLDRTPDRLASAKGAVERALQLDPGLPMAHFALGHYYAAAGDDSRALDELRLAARDLPSDSELFRALGVILRTRGDWPESVEQSKHALELSPRDPRIATSLGFTHTLLRRYPEADELYEQALALEPNQISSYVVKTLNHWLVGDLAGARATLEVMPQADHPSALAMWWQQELQEGDYRAALRRLEASPFEVLEDYLHWTPKSQLVATTYALLGRPEAAESALETARRLLERRLAEQPRDARTHGSLGLVLAALGNRQRALEEGLLAIELMPVAEDAVGGAVQLENLARLYVLTGDHDDAIEQLEKLLAIPCAVSEASLRIDPRWDNLRDHPRFREILSRR